MKCHFYFDLHRAVFGFIQRAKAQISLRIGAIGSGPLLSANRLIRHDRTYQLRVNSYVRMRGMYLNLCILRMVEENFSPGAAHQLQILLNFPVLWAYMMRNAQIGPLCNLQTTYIHSLRIRAVWSQHFLTRVSIDSVSGQRGPRSTCADAQADQGLRCLHIQ